MHSVNNNTKTVTLPFFQHEMMLKQIEDLVKWQKDSLNNDNVVTHEVPTVRVVKIEELPRWGRRPSLTRVQIVPKEELPEVENKVVSEALKQIDIGVEQLQEIIAEYENAKQEVEQQKLVMAEQELVFTADKARILKEVGEPRYKTHTFIGIGLGVLFCQVILPLVL